MAGFVRLFVGSLFCSCSFTCFCFVGFVVAVFLCFIVSLGMFWLFILIWLSRLFGLAG